MFSDLILRSSKNVPKIVTKGSVSSLHDQRQMESWHFRLFDILFVTDNIVLLLISYIAYHATDSKMTKIYKKTCIVGFIFRMSSKHANNFLRLLFLYFQKVTLCICS